MNRQIAYAVLLLTIVIWMATASAQSPANDAIRDATVHSHIMALENSGHGSIEEALAVLESRHFSDGYLVETKHDERIELLNEIRAAFADVGGILVQEIDDSVHIVLEGPRNALIVFTPQPAAPFKIDAIRIEAGGSAQPAVVLSWDGVESTFDELATKGFSGVLHLSRNGKTVLQRAYGKSNRELGFATQLDTVYGIGSTPIDFTVAGIYLLAQQGKLSLDAKINTLLAGVPDDKQAMTIHHLISGQSGLPDFHDRPGDWDADLAWIDRDTAVRRILAQPLLFPPGESRAHSHSAYGLAAAIIEMVSGEDYFDFLSSNFFKPAGMERTHMYGNDAGLSVRDFAVGYGNSSVGVPNIPPNWGPTSWLVMGSGGMYSTIGDMLLFYEFVRSGKVLEQRFAERYLGETVGMGGSDRGFYIFQASRGQDAEVMMIINGEGRSPEMRALSRALEALVMQDT